MSVLVIAESNGKEVDRGTLSAITAAQKISNEISLLILEESEEVIKKFQLGYVPPNNLFDHLSKKISVFLGKS